MKIKMGLILLLVFTGLNFLGASPGYSLDIITLASGGDHTVALRVDGTVWTWGQNGSGQLGNGSWTNSNVPTRVAMLRNIDCGRGRYKPYPGRPSGRDRVGMGLEWTIANWAMELRRASLRLSR